MRRKEVDVALLLIYIFLGLSAFILPRFVHYAKEFLEVLDVIAFIIFIVKFISIASNAIQLHNIELASAGLQSLVNEYLYDYVEGSVYYFIYLIFANISRGIRFGRINPYRIAMYFTIIILLFIILKLIASIQ